MPTWTHKDIEISFNEEHSDFRAVIDGKKVRAASLDSMRDRISKRAAVDAFEFIKDSYGTIKVLKVVGIKRGKFIDEQGGEHYSVVRNTPENMALVEAYLKISKTNGEKERALRDETRAAHALIPVERP